MVSSDHGLKPMKLGAKINHPLWKLIISGILLLQHNSLKNVYSSDFLFSVFTIIVYLNENLGTLQLFNPCIRRWLRIGKKQV